MASTAHLRGTDDVIKDTSVAAAGAADCQSTLRRFDQTFSYEGKLSIIPSANSHTASAHVAALNGC